MQLLGAQDGDWLDLAENPESATTWPRPVLRKHPDVAFTNQGTQKRVRDLGGG